MKVGFAAFLWLLFTFFGYFLNTKFILHYESNLLHMIFKINNRYLYRFIQSLWRMTVATGFYLLLIYSTKLFYRYIYFALLSFTLGLLLSKKTFMKCR